MRRIRFRIGLRTALILIMIAAFLSWVGVRIVPWAWQMWARSVEYREMADFVQSQPRMDLRIADESEGKARKIQERAGPEDKVLQEQAGRERRWAAYHRKMSAYHAALERWYRRGAARPWEALPPMPEAPVPVPDPASVGSR
ncbi:hypothetical protein ACYOEI_06960 [Singulisphaera rosea]